jgi:hypothetical protein
MGAAAGQEDHLGNQAVTKVIDKTEDRLVVKH